MKITYIFSQVQVILFLEEMCLLSVPILNLRKQTGVRSDRIRLLLP